jgi:hypothetical protein
MPGIGANNAKTPQPKATEFHQPKFNPLNDQTRLTKINLPKTLTLSFTEGNCRRYFSINPKNDLVCIQPFGHNSIKWSDFAWSVPFLEHHTAFCHYHVALEFDPTWATGFDKEFVDYNQYNPLSGTAEPLNTVVKAASDELFWLQRLWFTDYRLRLKPRATYSDHDRHTFDGLGCRFVEVKADDDEWEIPNDTTDDPTRCESRSWVSQERHQLSTFRFVKDLYDSLDDYFWETYYTSESFP